MILMAYTKQNFEDGQTLKAEHLNKMEEGIKDTETLVLYCDQEFYLYADSDVSDTSKRLTKEQFLELFGTGRPTFFCAGEILIFAMYVDTSATYIIAYAMVGNNNGTPVIASFHTAEYTAS